MAAPTDVRVEALSITSTIIRWVYAAAATPIAVYRSTDGVIYAEVTTLETRVVPGTLSFTDTGLATATKYWYKLTDDLGLTFSSVVTVFTHTCAAPSRENIDTTLPRFGDTNLPSPEAVDPDPAKGVAMVIDDLVEVKAKLDDFAVRVETGWTRFIDPDGRTCEACISDGAVVIDCINYDMCDVIEVEVTEDINSVSMPNCDNSIKDINFLIPPNTTRKICGFPGGSGFGGDECFRAPIRGGANGRTVSVPIRRAPVKSRPGVVRGLTGGTGATCTCVPSANGGLTIKSCTPNNSLSCSGGKSLTLKACGGRPPYTWSKTGSITLQAGAGATPGSTAIGSQITVKPPTNSGSAVAGDAYQICWFQESRANCAAAGSVTLHSTRTFGCNDSATAACNTAPGSCAGATPAVSALPCIGALGGCEKPECTTTGCTDGKQVLTDTRTAPMIAAGCNPCGLQSGSTVSVTDSMGTVATIILRN